MNKKVIIFIIVLSLITIIVASIYFGKLISKEISTVVNEKKEHSIGVIKTYNTSKTNEISEYIPKNIKKIVILNNLSDKNNPTTINIEGIDRIEEFMNLIFLTSWDERNENQISRNFDGAYYEIKLFGDTEMTINMQGYGGYNIAYGLVKIGNKHYYIDRSVYQNMVNFTVEKYYLHDSDLEVPTQEKCYEAQTKVLNALTEGEKKSLQENIRFIHIDMEHELLDAVRLIKDINSPYWEDFTSYGVFTDPFTGTKVDNGGRFLYVLDELAKIKNIPKNEQVRDNLQKAYDILKEGMEEHNLGKCFEAHKIIHDYDYFVINTPVHLDFPPADWGGTTNYFGTVTIIN